MSNSNFSCTKLDIQDFSELDFHCLLDDYIEICMLLQKENYVAYSLNLHEHFDIYLIHLPDFVDQFLKAKKK